MRRIPVGVWRTENAGPMQVVSDLMGRERIHFEAPDASRLENEMKTFLEWLDGNDEIDPVLRAGVAHLWFVTFHPFEDGNGRIARAIEDMALARADRMPARFCSISAQIASEQQEYYRPLGKRQRATPELTGWLEWFLDCLSRTITGA